MNDFLRLRQRLKHNSATKVLYLGESCRMTMYTSTATIGLTCLVSKEGTIDMSSS